MQHKLQLTPPKSTHTICSCSLHACVCVSVCYDVLVLATLSCQKLHHISRQRDKNIKIQSSRGRQLFYLSSSHTHIHTHSHVVTAQSTARTTTSTHVTAKNGEGTKGGWKVIRKLLVAATLRMSNVRQSWVAIFGKEKNRLTYRNGSLLKRYARLIIIYLFFFLQRNPWHNFENSEIKAQYAHN